MLLVEEQQRLQIEPTLLLGTERYFSLPQPSDGKGIGSQTYLY